MYAIAVVLYRYMQKRQKELKSNGQEFLSRGFFLACIMSTCNGTDLTSTFSPKGYKEKNVQRLQSSIPKDIFLQFFSSIFFSFLTSARVNIQVLRGNFI